MSLRKNLPTAYCLPPTFNYLVATTISTRRLAALLPF
jgi:hypothetical protein